MKTHLCVHKYIHVYYYVYTIILLIISFIIKNLDTYNFWLGNVSHTKTCIAHTYTHTHTHTHTHIHTYTHTHIYTYAIKLHIHIHIHKLTYLHIQYLNSQINISNITLISKIFLTIVYIYTKDFQRQYIALIKGRSRMY